MDAFAADFGPPEEPRIEHYVPHRVRHRRCQYDFQEFLPTHLFDGTDTTKLDSRAFLRKAIADVGLDVDQTMREAEAQHAAALHEWRSKWDSGVDVDPSEPSEQRGTPSEDRESAAAEPEDADDLPPRRRSRDALKDAQPAPRPPSRSAYLSLRALVILGTPLLLSLWRGLTHTRGALEHVEIKRVRDIAYFWEETRRVTDDKDGVEYYSRGYYPTVRKDAHRVGPLGAILDVDETKTPFEEAHRRLVEAGVPHAMHRSFSDGLPEKGNRYRIFVPWCADSKAARQQLVAQVFEIIGATPSSDSWSASGLYVPTVREGDEREWKILVHESGTWRPSEPPGEALERKAVEAGDPDGDLDAVRGDHDPDEVRALLEFCAEQGWLDEEGDWTEVAMMMAYWNHPEAEEVLDEASAECTGYDPDENARRFARFRRTAAERPAGNLQKLPTLFQRAMAAGFKPRPPRATAREDFAEPLDEGAVTVAEAGVASDWRPGEASLSTTKEGTPYKTFRNVLAALRALKLGLGFDVMAGRVVMEGPGLTWLRRQFPGLRIAFTDAHGHAIRTALLGLWGFEPSLVAIHEGIHALAHRNPFSPVVRWLDGLEWDGVPCLESWLVDYCGAEDTPYTRAVGRLLLLGAVARARVPGIKFDPMVVLEGPQGVGKSSLLALLGGEYYGEGILGNLRHAEVEVSRALAGKWLIEVDEMLPADRASAQALKSFLSRTRDTVRRPYGREYEDLPRQCIFVGTTNEASYLKDSTGNRRFLPVGVGAINLDAVARDREQLFAEADAAWRADPRPEALVLPRDLWGVAAEATEDRRIAHPWEELVAEYLEKEGLHQVRGKVLLDNALGIDSAKQTMADTKKLSDVMQRLGWKRKPYWDPDRKKTTKGYVKADGGVDCADVLK